MQASVSDSDHDHVVRIFVGPSCMYVQPTADLELTKVGTSIMVGGYLAMRMQEAFHLLAEHMQLNHMLRTFSFLQLPRNVPPQYLSHWKGIHTLGSHLVLTLSSWNRG